MEIPQEKVASQVASGTEMKTVEKDQLPPMEEQEKEPRIAIDSQEEDYDDSGDYGGYAGDEEDYDVYSNKTEKDDLDLNDGYPEPPRDD